MAIPMKREDKMPKPQTIEDVLVRGDLSALTAEQRTQYYMQICQSLGLNPMTQPFAFITLNGRLVLYALRACADQLRKINGISLEIVSQDLREGLLTVHVRAKDKHGRTDEDLGVVSVGNLKGEAAANAILKAVTKAKRRVTLSISGLGYLDETEVEDIPAKAKGPAAIADNPIKPPGAELPPHDPETGEIGPHKIAVPDLDDGGKKDWIGFGGLLLNAIRASESKAESDRWVGANTEALAEMHKAAPKVARRLMDAIKKRDEEFAVNASVPNPAEKPEEYFAWLTEQCNAAKDMADIYDVSQANERYIADAFPPDIANSREIVQRRRAVLEAEAEKAS